MIGGEGEGFAHALTEVGGGVGENVVGFVARGIPAFPVRAVPHQAFGSRGVVGVEGHVQGGVAPVRGGIGVGAGGGEQIDDFEGVLIIVIGSVGPGTGPGGGPVEGGVAPGLGRVGIGAVFQECFDVLG